MELMKQTFKDCAGSFCGGVFNILLTPCLNTGSALNFIHYTFRLCNVIKTETKDP